MKLPKATTTFISFFLSFFLFAAPSFAAAPDGLGPWADSVFSFHQGLMKNGQPVSPGRSDPTQALGVAEFSTSTGFVSLGLGGSISLGFDNGIRNGAMVIQATKQPYPDEKATIEMSSDGVNWVTAGDITFSGTVDKPASITCAKYVRITDISDPSIHPDDTFDGYDVDGVRSNGDPCTNAPTPTITPTPLPTSIVPSAMPTPTTAPEPTATPTPGSTSNTPGLPNTGGSSCTSTGVTTIPSILLARRTSPTSIFVSWGPFAGLNNFIVRYGFVNGTWLFTTTVSGFSTTINDLPASQSIWIQVAATDNCVVGSYSPAVLVGGTAATNTPGFPNTGNPLTPGFPNTGTPGFPNTGFAPKKNSQDLSEIFSKFQSNKTNTCERTIDGYIGY